MSIKIKEKSCTDESAQDLPIYFRGVMKLSEINIEIIVAGFKKFFHFFLTWLTRI